MYFPLANRNSADRINCDTVRSSIDSEMRVYISSNRQYSRIKLATVSYVMVEISIRSNHASSESR